METMLACPCDDVISIFLITSSYLNMHVSMSSEKKFVSSFLTSVLC